MQLYQPAASVPVVTSPGVYTQPQQAAGYGEGPGVYIRPQQAAGYGVGPGVYIQPQQAAGYGVGPGRGRQGKYPHYKSSAAVYLGITQLLLTLLMIIVIAVLFSFDVQSNSYEYIPFAAIITAIIGGISTVFFIITGAISICSGKYKTTCLIASTLVLCIICLLLCCTACFGFYVSQLFVYDGVICEGGDYGYYDQRCEKNTNVVICFAIGLVICIAFIVVTIMLSVIGCQALCCKPKASQRVQYVQGGQPMYAQPRPQPVFVQNAYPQVL